MNSKQLWILLIEQDASLRDFPCGKPAASVYLIRSDTCPGFTS
ncbi:hypothetical protein [Marinobacter sp.]